MDGDRTITARDGRTIGVHESGDPAGRPFIDCHGTPGGRLDRDPDATIYARHGLRRISFDRPGYGRSDRLPGRAVADVAGDVAAIADALGLDRFLVGGASGGGPHALACAALLPDRVERCLAVVSVAPFEAPGLDFFDGMTEGNVIEFGVSAKGEEPLRELLAPLRAEMLERVEAGRLDFLGDAYELSDEDKAELETMLPLVRESWPDALGRGVDGWIDDDLAFVTPWGFDPAAIRVPTAVCYGKTDTLVPAAHGAWLAARVPGAVEIFSTGGHLGDAADAEKRIGWLVGS